MEFEPLTRSLARLEGARSDSDTTYFFELLYTAELLLKLLVLGVVSSVEIERERHQYAMLFDLARADSPGAWAEVLHHGLTGPPAHFALRESQEFRKQLTEKVPTSAGGWQAAAVEHLHQAGSVFGDTDGLSNRVALRQWADIFGRLRNATRGHGAPLAGKCSRACEPLHSSLTLIINNVELLQRPWAYLHRNLSGKYNVRPLCAANDAFEELRRSRDYNLEDGVYVVWDEPRLTPLIYSDVDLRDFYVANGKFNGSTLEALSYVTDDRVSIDAKPWLLPPNALPKSETEAPEALDVVGDLFAVLPSARGDYVRRTALEDELRSILANDRHPVVTLVGRGGIGKTSVALRVLHDFAEQDSEFEYIFWFSARDIDLLDQGPKAVNPQFLRLEDIATDFHTLISSHITVESDEGPLDLLRECLSDINRLQGAALFVFDNFETVDKPNELYAFLDAAIRLPNKVLITTRSREFKGDYPVTVGGMSHNEFSELVRLTSSRLGISDLIDRAYQDRLFDESDGHPYVVKVLLGEVATAGRVVTVERVMATKDQILDALFQRTYELMSPGTQRTFLTLCSWRSNIPRLALEAALLRSTNSDRIDVNEALLALERSSMIEVEPASDDEEIIRVPLAASVFGRKKVAVHGAKLAIEADARIMQLFGASKAVATAESIESRVQRMLNSVAKELDGGASIGSFTDVLAFISTRYPPVRIIISRIYDEYVPGEQGLMLAVGEVEKYLEDQPHDVDGWRRLASLRQAAGNGLGEVQARLELAALEAATITDVSTAANRLNSGLADGSLVVDSDEKGLVVNRLRDLFTARAHEADATDLSRLAWLCMHLRDKQAARHWATEGLSLDAANSHCQTLMARLAA